VKLSTRESRRAMTFLFYRKVFDDAWRDFDAANQTVPDRSKVTFLIEGLGDQFVSIKNQVVTNEELMNNYERAAVYIATCLTNMESAVVVRARQVSELSTRQYSQEEWSKLS